METTINTVDPIPVPVPGDPDNVPVRTKYNDQADGYVAKLNAMMAEFPVEFQTRHRTKARLVDARIGVPMKCLSAGVAALERSPKLQSVSRIDAAEARDQLQMLEAYLPVLLLAEKFFFDMKFTLNTIRADLANNTLKVYGVAKTLGRDGEDPESAQLADVMGRELGRKRIPKLKKSAKQPAAPPSGGVPAPSSKTTAAAVN